MVEGHPEFSPETLSTSSESKGPAILGVSVSLWAAAGLSCILRVYARRRTGNALWWDDWLAVFAWIMLTCVCTAHVFEWYYGAGQHILNVLEQNPTHLDGFLKSIYAAQITYPLVIGPIRSSICYLYIRIFGHVKLLRWYCYVLIWLTGIWAIATLIGLVLQCRPISSAWTQSRDGCLDMGTFLMAVNLPNVILDFLVLTAPIRPIWVSTMATRKKAFVIAILCLGAGETAVSVARCVVLQNLGGADPTWDFSTIIILSCTEESVGVMCACIPAMASLLPERLVERICIKARQVRDYCTTTITLRTFSELDERTPGTTVEPGDGLPTRPAWADDGGSLTSESVDQWN